MDKITRIPIRDQVYQQLIEGIVSGVIPAGARLKDTEIAEKMGVSRTPVREALVKLTNEGYLISTMNKGFDVAALHEADVVEIYPIIAELEILALRSGITFDETVLNQLRDINSSLANHSLTFEEKNILDEQWHRLLYSQSANTMLITLIEDLKKKTKWFEFQFMRNNKSASASVNEHDVVLQYLRSGEREKAAEMLRNNCLATYLSIISKK